MTVKKIEIGDVFPTNQGDSCTVIEYKGWDKVCVEFNDEHKHRMLVRSNHLRNGAIKNPYFPQYQGLGYIGFGRFTTGNVCHKTWSSMISRCYKKSRSVKNDSYKGCIVCPEWHNYQVFAEWYEDQNQKWQGFQIDKDILKNGNSEYCPEYCCLVPAEINAIFIGCNKEGKLPLGVSIRKSTGKFKASICLNNKPTALGDYDTPEQAHKVYMQAKIDHINKLANKWKNYIDDRVYKSLIEWGQK